MVDAALLCLACSLLLSACLAALLEMKSEGIVCTVVWWEGQTARNTPWQLWAPCSCSMSVLEQLAQWGVASWVPDRHEWPTGRGLSLAVRRFLDAQAQNLLHERATCPLLSSYSLDSTSTVLATAPASTSLGGSRSMHRGQGNFDLMLQRHMLRALPAATGGEQRVVQRYFEPKPMTSGKSLWHAFALATESWPLPGRQGHRGPQLLHLCADRPQLQALQKLLAARLQLWQQAGPEQGGPAEVGSGAGFQAFVSTACALHDCSNSLAWACKPWGSGGCLEAAQEAMTACRKSSLALAAGVGSALLSTARFRERQDGSPEERAAWWKLLGVGATQVEPLVDLDPLWTQQGLLVSAETLPLESDVMAPLSEACIYLLRQRHWQSTRFLGLAQVAQGWACAASVGLDRLLEVAKQHALASPFHLRGLERLDQPVKRLLAVALVSGQLPMEVAACCMEDDRLLLQSEHLVPLCDQVLQQIHDLPDFCWKRLAMICSLAEGEEQWQTLRQDCLQASHVAAAYLYERVFRLWKEWPWRLAVGSPERLLRAWEDLKEADQDHLEPLSLHLSQLLRAGAPRAWLQPWQDLLLQVPWSTILVEQAHASSSTIARLHPVLQVSHHTLRCFLHQVRFLVTQSEAEKREERLLKDLLALDKGLLKGCTGRQAFLAEAVSRAQRVLAPGQKLSHRALLHLMRSHAQEYAQLPEEQRRQWDLMASRQQTAKASQALEDKELRLQQHRLEEGRRQALLLLQGPSYLNREQKLSTEAKEDLQAFFASAMARSAQEVLGERQGLLEAPDAPPEDVQQVLLQASQDSHRAQAPRRFPDWCKTLALHRDDLVGAIICPSLDAGAHCWRLVYATLNPRHCVFQILTLREQATLNSAADLQRNFWQVLEEHWEWEFDVLVGHYLREDEIPPCEEQNLWLLWPSSFMEATRVVANGPARSCPDLLSWWPRQHYHRQGEGAAEPRRPGTRSTLQTEAEARPWLRAFLAGETGHQGRLQQQPAASSSRGTAAHQGQRPGADSARPGLQDLTPEQEDALWLELTSLRQQVEQPAEMEAGAQHHFVHSLRGGRWTRQHRGQVADAVAARAATQEALQWVGLFGSPKQASFSTIKYGLEEATVLALEWCRRRQQWIQLWLRRGAADSMAYSAEDLQLGAAPEDLQAFLMARPPQHPVHQRMSEVLAWLPQAASAGSAS